MGGTIQGYGVKFSPPGTPMAGQNERATMPIMQYINRETVIVYPAEIRSREAVIPLPKSNPYAAD